MQERALSDASPQRASSAEPDNSSAGCSSPLRDVDIFNWLEKMARYRGYAGYTVNSGAGTTEQPGGRAWIAIFRSACNIQET